MPERPISSGTVTYRSVSSALHPGGLRDDLDERRHRVRVRLDVELLVRGEPDHDEQHDRREDHERHAERGGDDSLDHGPRSELPRQQDGPADDDLLTE